MDEVVVKIELLEDVCDDPLASQELEYSLAGNHHPNNEIDGYEPMTDDGNTNEIDGYEPMTDDDNTNEIDVYEPMPDDDNTPGHPKPKNDIEAKEDEQNLNVNHTTVGRRTRTTAQTKLSSKQGKHVTRKVLRKRKIKECNVKPAKMNLRSKKKKKFEHIENDLDMDSSDNDQIKENKIKAKRNRNVKQKLPKKSSEDAGVLPDGSKLKLDGSYHPDSDDQFDNDITCHICDTKFKHAKYLRRHKRMIHKIKEDSCVCKVCNKVLRNEKDLARHLNIHTTHLCDKCGKVFKQTAHLQVHYRTMHEEHSYECEFDGCSKVFGNTANRTRHMNAVHLNLRKYPCCHCTMVFKTTSSLKAHKYSRHTELESKTRHTCNVCRKTFYSKSHMKLHERIHTNVKPFTCDHEDCDKQFRDKSNLMKHQRVHDNVKPYSCDVCEEEFSRKVYLEQHQYKHTGVKMFQCPTCNKSFTQKGNMNAHMILHTKNRTVYECSKCDRTFNHKSNFTKHMLNHTIANISHSKGRKQRKRQILMSAKIEYGMEMVKEEHEDDDEDFEKTKEMSIKKEPTSKGKTRPTIVVYRSGNVVVNDPTLVKEVVKQVQERENTLGVQVLNAENNVKHDGYIDPGNKSQKPQEKSEAIDLRTEHLVTEDGISETRNEAGTIVVGESVTAIEQDPFTKLPVVENPITTMVQEPVSLIAQEPVTIIQEPINLIVQEPVTTIVQEPVTTLIQEPVTTVVQEPVIFQEPVSTIIQEPVNKQEPVTTIVHLPATTIIQEPLTTIIQQPDNVQEPLTTIIQQPDNVQEPVITIMQEPVTTIVQAPVTTTVHETENFETTEKASTVENQETIVFVTEEIASQAVNAAMLKDFLDQHGVTAVEMIPANDTDNL